MSSKAKIVITKLNKTKSGRPLYRVMKLINSRRLSLMEQDYEEDELQLMLSGLPMTFDYTIINNTLTKWNWRLYNEWENIYIRDTEKSIR